MSATLLIVSTTDACYSAYYEACARHMVSINFVEIHGNPVDMSPQDFWRATVAASTSCQILIKWYATFHAGLIFGLMKL